MKYVLYALLAWFLYQLIFKLVIPVYKTTRQIKKGFREMQEKMSFGSAQDAEYQRQQQAYTSQKNQHAGSQTQKAPSGDYIDFEEVK